MPKPFSEHRTIAVQTGNSILAQCRKPSGWLGRLLLWKMNRHHSRLTDWGLTHIPIEQNDTILDVGCGGGRTVSKLAAAATQGMVYGLDYSDESIAASTRNNARLIASGHVQLRQESVSQLPFSDGTQQEPGRLVEARDVHLRVHVAGEVVLRSQHRALKGVDPFGHVPPFHP